MVANKAVGAAANKVIRFIQAWVIGTLEGGLSGATVTALLFWLEGNLQPVEGFVSPHLYSATLGLLYGACCGAIATPIAYPSYLRKNRLRTSFFVPAIITAGGLLLIFLLIPIMFNH